MTNMIDTKLEMNYLRTHWDTLWTSLGAQGDSSRVFRDLIRRYIQRRRVYHNLDHLIYCITLFHETRNLSSNPNTVEYALWFHDAVYDPISIFNESRSARLAVTTAKNALLSEDFQLAVMRLILATTHTQIDNHPDVNHLCDIDLSPLGQPELDFFRLSLKLRKESRMIPDDQYYINNSKFIDSMLSRPSIFQTQYFQNKYEKQAQDNLNRLLSWSLPNP